MLRLATILFAVCSSQLLAQPSAFGKLIQEFVRSFNTGDDAMRTFFEQNFVPGPPVEERTGRYRQNRAEFGTLTLTGVSAETAMSADAALTGSKGVGLTMTFRFAAGPEPKVAAYTIRLGKPPEEDSTAGPKLSEAEALKEIAAVIDRHSRADAFSGTAMVARGEEVLLEKAVGFFDLNAEAPNRPDTLFNVGSIVKLMTRFCVARLWAERKLSLDDTIGKFLPDYPNREAAAIVTIRHLLTMTSGIGDFFGPAYAATSKDRIYNLASHLPFFAAESLAFKPGTSEKYSNGGYLVLGLIIEKLTRISYYEFVEQTIFEPLGMKDTGFYELDVPRGKLSTGYTRTAPDKPRRSNVYTLSRRGSSAGGAYSTLRDLFAFARALQSKKLEPKNAPDELRMGESFSFGGGAPGVNAVIRAGIPGGYTVIALANYDPPAAIDVVSEITRILRRVPR